MDKNFNTDDFERMLKDKSDEFRMIPSKRVWHSIYNDLHPSRKWPSVAMSLVLIAALLITGYLNTGNSSKKNNDKNLLAANKNSGDNDNDLQSNKNNVSDHPDDQVASIDRNTISTTPKSSAADNPSKNLVVVHNRYRNNRPVSLNSQGNVDVSVDNSAAKQKGLISDNTPNDNPANLSGVNGTSITNIVDPTSLNGNSNAVKANTDKTDDVADNKSQLSANENSISNEAAAEANKDKADKTASNTSKLSLISKDQKVWLEDYAFHNKPISKKWKGVASWELYATPSVTNRIISDNSNSSTGRRYLNGPFSNNPDVTLKHSPSVGLELGSVAIFPVSKKLRVKTGLQLNYTRYNIMAWETNHPIQTTLTLNDPATGYSYEEARSTTYSSAGGLSEVMLHSKTYQVSTLAGLDLRVYNNEKLKVYVGATIQPSYVFAGKVYLLSSDHRSYVEDKSMLRKFNLVAGLETFVSYKTGSYTWQVGPQLRYQLLSTYVNKSAQKENLINAGIKFGIVKLF